MNESLSKKIKYSGFIMTCLMILYHTPRLSNSFASGALDGNVNSLYSTSMDTMGGFVMSYFFAVTGYLLFVNLDIRSYPKKLKRRISSLLIPFLAWQCIVAFLLFVSGNGMTLKSFLVRTFTFVCWPPDGSLWYMYAVFWLAVFSPALILLFSNRKAGWITVVSVTVIINAVISKGYFKEIVDYGYVYSILTYLPSYLLGAFYARFEPGLKNKSSLIYIASLIVIAMLLNGVITGFLETLIIRILPFTLIILLPEIPCFYDKKIYNISFLMYAMHSPFLYVTGTRIRNYIAFINIPVSVYNIIAGIFVLISVIILAYIVYVILQKSIPGLLSIITGGRAVKIKE